MAKSKAVETEMDDFPDDFTDDFSDDTTESEDGEEQEKRSSSSSSKSKSSKKGKGVKKLAEIVRITNQEEKMKALESALTKMEKDFGKGAVMKLGDNNKNNNIEVTPTGSLMVDLALGVGGIPKGRIIEVYGPESSGKTTLALHMVSEVQKRKGIGGYVDAEHALDPVYAQKLGVDINDLYISQPDDGEQALAIAEAMVRSAAIDIVVVDSVAALVPRAEIEGEMGDSHVGLHARLMSQALRKLAGIISKYNCTVIFINQLREKIGVTYGSPEVTTGGRALKFYASVRLDIRKGETVKIGDAIVGNRTKVKVAKNKVAPPFKTAEFDIIFGEGVSHVGEVLDLASDLNIVNKAGAWYSYGDTRLGQGREIAKKFLRNDPDLLLEIENKVRAKYDLKPLDAPPAAVLAQAKTVEIIKPEEEKPAAKSAPTTEPATETEPAAETETAVAEAAAAEAEVSTDAAKPAPTKTTAKKKTEAKK